MRPAILARHLVWIPLAGLLLGAAAPSVADAARPALEAAVLVLVFACVTAAEFAVPKRVEVRSALLMIVATSIACPVAAGLLASVAGLPDDLSVAAVLAAASPVAIGAGALCRSFGLPERPAVWAALGGLALGPALLPAVTIVAVPGSWALPLAIHTLAERAALLGALPACAAFLFRLAAPRVATAIAPDLRGVAVVGLWVLALCAGGAAAETISHAVPDEGSALLVIIVAAFGASSAVWVMQRLVPSVPDRALSREMLIVSGARNISLVWASTLGVLTLRGHAVLAVAVAGTFVLPAAVPTFLIAMSRSAAWTRARMAGDLPASSRGLRWPSSVGALAACLALLTMSSNYQDRIKLLPAGGSPAHSVRSGGSEDTLALNQASSPAPSTNQNAAVQAAEKSPSPTLRQDSVSPDNSGSPAHDTAAGALSLPRARQTAVIKAAVPAPKEHDAASTVATPEDLAAGASVSTPSARVAPEAQEAQAGIPAAVALARANAGTEEAAAVAEPQASSDVLPREIADLQRQAGELKRQSAQRLHELDQRARDMEQNLHDLDAPSAEIDTLRQDTDSMGQQRVAAAAQQEATHGVQHQIADLQRQSANCNSRLQTARRT